MFCLLQGSGKSGAGRKQTQGQRWQLINDNGWISLFSPCGARWSLWNEKRKESSTEILVAFAIIALVAAILIVYFDTAHKLKLLAERIESIEMSGRRPNNRVLREISPTNET